MDADVAIVGAGAAGIAAALWLSDRSVRVIVVEGRDRIGGRVMWRPVGSVDVPAELGAEFIHGPAPETSAFLASAGLAKIETDGTAFVVGPDGVLLPDEDDFHENEIFERVRSLGDDESVDAFLARFETDPQTRAGALQARAFVEGFEAADPALASVCSIADEIRSGVDSKNWRPVGSYAPLFDYLTTRCANAGVDIRLNSVVERISWERGGVSIDVRTTGAGASTIRARCAIVTVPVGVLRHRNDAKNVMFEPPLPERQQAAIRGLEMGHAVRVTLAFRTPFWETIAAGRYRDASFFRGQAGAFTAFWAQLPIRTRTIVAWAGGPRATAMEGVSQQERIGRALEEFGAMLGERDLALREFEGGVTHDWASDPFAFGAYSYVATGALGARDALATPVDDTLFFAGEATATDGQGGTVSGAFGSGARAARQAARALSRGDEPAKIEPHHA